MHVAPKLAVEGDPAHRPNHSITHDEGANVAAVALLDEFLDQHVLPRALQRLHDGLGNPRRVGQDHADALSSLEQLDHDRRTADPFDRRQHRRALAHEGRSRDRQAAPAQHL
jgi:hypothetical protein